jgi:hypothetical protein
MSEKNWSEFKKSYPNATDKNFSAYPRGINFNYNGMAYDVFVDKIGGPIHHYLDQKLGKALTNSLGKPTDGNNHKQPLHVTHQTSNTFPKRVNNGESTVPYELYTFWFNTSCLRPEVT